MSTVESDKCLTTWANLMRLGFFLFSLINGGGFLVEVNADGQRIVSGIPIYYGEGNADLNLFQIEL